MSHSKNYTPKTKTHKKCIKVGVKVYGAAKEAHDNNPKINIVKNTNLSNTFKKNVTQHNTQHNKCVGEGWWQVSILVLKHLYIFLNIFIILFILRIFF